MQQPLRLTYLIPVHNEGPFLATHVNRLRSRLQEFPGSEILLIENGSSDNSFEVCKSLEGVRQGVAVRAVQLSQAGLGYALDRGFREASLVPEVAEGFRGEHWIALNAADLPFGFSDLEEFLRLRRKRQEELQVMPTVVIGSKAHRESRLSVHWTRRWLTWGYRILRRWVLNMKTADPQGTFFVRSDGVAGVVDRVLSRDFFYTTELVFWFEQRGVVPFEVPIIYLDGGEGTRKSTVRIFRDSWRMFVQLIFLRRRSVTL